MIPGGFLENIGEELEGLEAGGLYKHEYLITSSQSSDIEIENNGGKVLNFCANNYLGLANDERLVKAAQEGLRNYGVGTASVRFICGTMDIHRELEHKLADFLGYEDVITFSSCFAANGGLFAPLLSKEDAIITANLNHASLIDGIRLCKAERYFYEHDNMADLEEQLKAAQGDRVRMIVTDGVFSMDGDIAPLGEICDLAEKYDALVVVDDSHATGFIGKNGRGTIELCDVIDRVDILTSTLGKALGGAGGGFIASRKEIIAKLRNTSRPYLFSNNIVPAIAASTIKAIEIIASSKGLIKKLDDNTRYFRSKMQEAGFDIRPGVHPVVAVMFGDAKLASQIAKDMRDKEGIYVIAFSYPVVPKGEARIRVQLSAAHSKEHLDRAIQSFIKTGKAHGVI